MKKLALVSILITNLHAQSTIDPANPYAYSANAGWVNLHPSSANGVVIGDHFLAGYAYAANIGWIHFGDGSPDNSTEYQNNSATDYGVNQDSTGALTGYAYSANVGWITFEQTHGQPTLDHATGQFSGYAYSANIGWINLATGLTTNSMIYLDTDGDGIGDAWENFYFNGLTLADGTTDHDGDNQPDIQEYYANTIPLDPTSKTNYCLIRLEPNGISIYHTFTVTPGRTTVIPILK